MAENLNYRDAAADDLERIVAIYNSTVASRMVTADTVPVSVESRREWFHRHIPGKRPIWVIETEPKNIIGWISFEPFITRPAYNHTAEISIYLAGEARHKGIGKQVLQYALDQAVHFDIKVLVGYIFAHNTPSLKLFYSLGFEDWALLPDVAILDGVKRSLKIVGKKIQE
jgi:L-amino acid N-acyltransferase YncA